MDPGPLSVMSSASGIASAHRPRIVLQFQQKEGSVPAIRTVQGDIESDVVMDELHDSLGRSDGFTTEDEVGEEGEDEDEDDEEIDQLLSSGEETQPAPGVSASAASASKARTRMPRARSGHPPIPLARLQTIIDGEGTSMMLLLYLQFCNLSTLPCSFHVIPDDLHSF